VSATVITPPEHIVRVIRETVIVRTVTKSAKAAANNTGQVVKGVTKSGNFVQKGTSTIQSIAPAAGASLTRTGVGGQTLGSGSSGGSFSGFSAGGASNTVGGVSGGLGGAAVGLGGVGGSLGGGLGGTLGGSVSGALGGAGNAVGGLGGHH